MSYQAEFRTRSDTNFATNSLRFATLDEARGYGAELFSRWMGASDWRTAESTDPVNYTWTAAEGARRIAE